MLFFAKLSLVAVVIFASVYLGSMYASRAIEARTVGTWVQVGTSTCLVKPDGTKGGCWVPTQELATSEAHVR